MYCLRQTKRLKAFLHTRGSLLSPSLAYSEDKIHHSNNPAILECILNEGCDAKHCSMSQYGYDAIIHDGKALIHSLSPHGIHTFQEYEEEQFLKLIHTELRKASRVDVVWDCYREHFTKEKIRSDKGKGSQVKVSPRAQIT